MAVNVFDKCFARQWPIANFAFAALFKGNLIGHLASAHAFCVKLDSIFVLGLFAFLLLRILLGRILLSRILLSRIVLSRILFHRILCLWLDGS